MSMAGAVAQSPRVPAVPPATLIELEGTVQTARARAADWLPARTNGALAVLDRVRTREQSRATMRLLDRSLFRLGELSEITVEAPPDSQTPSSFSLGRGLLYFLHRGKPADVKANTRTVSAAIRGTEFLLEVADNGRTVLTLFDGEVELSNPQGVLRLVSGEQGAVDPGQAPVKTPLLIPKHDLIQWCLYYPGVLDADELNLQAAEATALQPSLAAYRAGDLLQALALVPAGFQPASDSARVYLAAVLLSVGKVDAATPLLDAIPPDAAENSDKPPAPRLATALRRLILVVKNSPEVQTLKPAGRDPKCSTLHLAESYRYQSRADLPSALAAAREATAISPAFGFAWARVAELEFSFGHRREAQAALRRSLELAPRNAQAVALRGFLLASEDRISAAFAAFNEAIALDGALGNAWLGRGLCRIRRGELNAGREDLQVAATLEPQRALFRSYLGKAWNELGDQRHAGEELRLARANDPRDPTAYLYEALLLQEENRINEAITSLERSQELNANRSVFRSRLLLDQDQAVRGANLATIYRDAGMTDWSTREAGKAVNADYANWSAHLFLANSYNELRDPRSVNLRFETPWLSEYLLANLLAPAGAGTLSQSVSQQEYSRLFGRDRLGLAGSTEYLSRGAWQQDIVQYGQSGRTAYALEGYYLTDPGERVNQDVRVRSLSLQFKQQLAPSDGLYFQAIVGDARSGDLNQYADPAQANPAIRVREEQKPLLLAGYHHEWAPGSHTLVLLSGLSGQLEVNDPTGSGFLIRTNDGTIDLLRPMRFGQEYENSLGIFGAEAQQILQWGKHTLVAGALGQFGAFDTDNRHTLTRRDAYDFAAFELANPKPQSIDNSFERETVYAYDTWQIWTPFRATVGLAYDRVVFPENHRYAPVLEGSSTVDQISPKAGWEWIYAPHGAVRFAWTRSLSGASFDQSFRLEPVQVAGFNQAFRSLIPETLTGANAGAPFETFGLAWEQRFGPGTYVGVGADLYLSDFDRTRGAYLWLPSGLVVPHRLTERLEYEEKSVHLSVDQIVGRDWVIGARYQFSRARLDTSYPDAPARVTNGDFAPDDEPILYSSRHTLEGDLHQIILRALFNHPSGFFAGTEGVWHGQQAESEESRLVSSWFWQWNARAGWRSPRRRVEASVGLLNMLNQSAGLHPVNLHPDPPQRRTFVAGLRFNF